MRVLIALAAGLVAGLAPAQQMGPALAVDAAADRRPISPDIYGFNWYWGGEDSAALQSSPAVRATAADLRRTVRRWGGNNTSRYQWQFDVMNIDNDWFFEVLPDTTVDASKLPDSSTFNRMLEYTRLTGGKLMGTIPILGWLPRARREMCSFDVAKYGPQCKQDPYAQYHPYTCGNGIVYDPACGDPNVLDGKAPAHPIYIANDPHDANAFFHEDLQSEWVNYLVNRYGRGNQGGVAIWSLDNEPVWWSSTHRDIHPLAQTYDETAQLGLAYAAAVKQADPTALVTGPVSAGWGSFFYSLTDMNAGWGRGGFWMNPVDRNQHGGIAFVPWYLQQFRQYEQQNRVRLLDYLDLHAYNVIPDGIMNGATDAASQAQRLQSTRVLWDPAYTAVIDPFWVRDESGLPVAPRLIPRMREWVDQNYPGTKTALTEYSWGALGTLNGALAQADVLGIFGREGLDMATLWATVSLTDPAAFAFKLYRNYDGLGGAFGETSVQATTGDADQLSIFAAERSDSALTILVLNKTAGDLTGAINLSNFTPGGKAQVWRYSQARLDAIVRAADLDLAGSTLAATFPAYSMTMFVVPATLSVPKPVVTAVTNAASYDTRIAPGQIVDIWGTNLGPKDLTGLEVGTNGLVKDSVSGVRILFDGIPGTVVYVQEYQCAAVVPYLAALQPTTHVQVEYQGARSDPLEVAISPTGPGLFTNDMSGAGPGAILNEDGRTRNSPDAPAPVGSVVSLWGTGEGVTNLPGVEGRLAPYDLDRLPRPLAQCSVEIGSKPATLYYCGAAPGNMPGLVQINAYVPDVPPGNQPVKVSIGGVSSRDGVTLAVR